MIRHMKIRLLAALAAVLCFLGTPPEVQAQRNQVQSDPVDARLQNYPQPAELPKKSTALTYFAFVILSVLCLAGLFKNARRTHLD
jgi:hypothetical protein